MFRQEKKQEEKMAQSSLSAPDIGGGVGDPGGAEQGQVTETGQQEGLQAGVIMGPHTGQAVIRPRVKLDQNPVKIIQQETKFAVSRLYLTLRTNNVWLVLVNSNLNKFC